MSDVAVEIVPQSRIMTFIRFAWNIYQDDPYWVPPLFMEKKNILNTQKNPLFKNAEMEMFMARRNGDYIGRIAAINNNSHNEIHGENTGFFGFFECIQDQHAADQLFDAAKEWLKKKGLAVMRGPASPTSNDEYGLLIEGFDDSPRLMMPYNPEYYRSLFESYGLKKIKDLLAYRIDNSKFFKSEKLIRVAALAQKRAGLSIRQINMKRFRDELEIVKHIYNKAWTPNWGFVPMTIEEIELLAKALKPLVEPSIILFGEIDEEPVGFALVILDYNELFKDFNGRLFPFNFIKIFSRRKNIEWARVIILGLLPEYRKRGLDAVFYLEVARRLEKIGIMKGEASWILEDNEMMKRGLEVMNASVYKKYRVYEKSI